MSDENTKFKQFDLLLNDDGEFYYKSDRVEIKKMGKEPWNYKVWLDGQEVKMITGIDISLVSGKNPIISLEIIDC